MKKPITIGVATLIMGITIAMLVATRTTFGQDKHDHQDEHGQEEGHDHDESAEHDKDEHGDEHGDEHSEHDEALRLSAEEMRELSITLAVAGPGVLDIQANLPGEVRLNEDRLAHVVPNIAGVVREVIAHLGDVVKTGDLMAVLASRELAETKADHLAAHAELQLLEVTFRREKQLWEDKISAEQDFLRARNSLEKARIALRASEQRLYALGLDQEAIHKSENESSSELTRFEVRAPFQGTIIEKHVTLGEAVNETSLIFAVADLSTVWVDLSVYAKDLLAIRRGQKVVISSDTSLPDTEGIISYIGPVVGEETRTAMARVLLPNPDELWKPGLFVTAQVATEEFEVRVKVPLAAFQTVEGQRSVFVETPEGLVARPVTVGRSDATHAEVTSGLEPGERIATSGTLLLKAELGKAAFSEGHAH